MSLSRDLAPQTSTSRDVSKDVLCSTDPPTRFSHSYEFEEGDEYESASDSMSIITLMNQEDICVQESHEGVVEPTNLEFSDDNFSVEHKSSLCGFDVNEDLNVDICVEYLFF